MIEVGGGEKRGEFDVQGGAETRSDSERFGGRVT
jgi:hypothetical protein